MRLQRIASVLAVLAASSGAWGAELSVNAIVMGQGTTSDVVVSGRVTAESVFGVTVQVELVPRAGASGTVTFTSAPPVDILQLGDPWPGAGTFNAFDTDTTGSGALNGSVDDNGTFVPAPTTFSGQLASFRVTSSPTAAGVWDVVLSTSAGVSQWDGSVATTLIAGSVTVQPSVSLSAPSFSMPPGSTVNAQVNGSIAGQSTFGVTILVELIPRAGTTGTLMFTDSPPVDVAQLGDPWPGVGTFSAFDADTTGSTVLNGSVDDNGTFVAGPVTFSGALTRFPMVASGDASGVWDMTLATSAGSAGWEGVFTALLPGTITVSAGACTSDAACNDGNPCTADSCVAGTCANVNTTDPCSDGDLCTINDTCSAGVCIGTAVPEGGACDDGDACTINDTCQSDVCAGTPRDCSSLDGVCGAGVCNPTTGQCVVSPSNEGGACDDGNQCTENDACLSGACVGDAVPPGTTCDDGLACTQNDACNNGACSGTAVDCSSLDTPCTDGVCNTSTGACESVAINEGGACDDGNSCSTGDQCVAGVCAGTLRPDLSTCDDSNLCTLNDVCLGGVCSGNAIDCSVLNTACTQGVCNPLTGICTANPINENGACDDSNNCTTGDHCVTGVCTTTPVDCSGLNTQCSVGVCNGVTGQCQVQPISEGQPCNDGSACTTSDTCSSGVCAGVATDCSSLNTTCAQGVCNPSNGQCVASPINNGGACTDNNRCTTGDICSAGSCVGTPLNCSSLNTTCTIGVCNSSSGTCVANPTNNGGACNDGLPCTTNDVCVSGTCAGTLVGPASVNLRFSPTSPSVNVGQPVVIDLIAASGSCANQPFSSAEVILSWDPTRLQLSNFTKPSGHTSSFPNDSNLDGLNAPFGQVPGNDGDALYLAVGPFPAGAIATPAGTILTRLTFTALDGDPASPLIIATSLGSFTNTRVLGAGAWVGQNITGTTGSATVAITECVTNGDCDDGNVCTTDTCTVDRLCVYANNSLPCSDNLFCTATDVCVSGACVSSGNPCSGGQFCNETLDACVQCLSDANCNDNNPCTNNVCNAFGQCTFPNNTLSCNDNLFCTLTDVCSGGVCVGSGNRCSGSQICEENNDRCVTCQTAAQCNDNNPCTDDSCNTSTGLCVHSNNTLPCNDNLFCTPNDVCSAGACVGSGVRCPGQFCNETSDACVNCLANGDCPSDGNVCTDERCISGNCFNVNNTLSCNDGLFCTATDVCSVGACVGSGARCPGQICDEPLDRCVQCLVSADCNDNIPCTTDTCNTTTGACQFTPNHAACSDGLFCNGSEVCQVGAGCVAGSQPCDSAILCNESTDTCTCAAPTVVAEGPKSIRVTPSPGILLVALRVTGNPSDSRIACVSGYVQANGTIGASPVFRTPAQWAIAHMGDSEIIPGATYRVQSDCRRVVGDPANLSTQVSATTWPWADVNNSGSTNFADISLIVAAFQGNFTGTSLYAVDLHDCVPNRVINFSDISQAVSAFSGIPYLCARPCP